jgi:hypothetical protein
MGGMDRVQEYIDAIPPGHRPFFDRVSGLILKEFPQASVALLARRCPIRPSTLGW